MKYEAFFRERIPQLAEANAKGESVNVCVFHADKNPSLGINLETGKWKCYTPSCRGHKGGGWKKFDELLNGGDPGVATSVTPISPDALAAFHEVLKASQTPLDILHNHRGYTDETIARFKLGWDGDRILIPIQAKDGSYLNVRKYKFGASKDKLIAWGPGYNQARLFPIESLESDWVLLVEGETDAMLACQHGFPAITSTNGADSWPESFTGEFSGKKVVVCYDSDRSGKVGARNVAGKLSKVSTEVRILALPLKGTKDEKDLTDYLHKLKHTTAELQALIDAAEPVNKTEEKPPPTDEVIPLHLSAIGEDKYVSKRVESTVLIAGKDLAPFQVPKCIKYTCGAVDSEKMCGRCGIGQGMGKKDVRVPDWSPDLLQMVNVPIEKLNWLIGKLGSVPEKCPKFQFEVSEYVNIESIKAIPEIDFAAANAEYVIRNLFYLGHGIETNHTYDIKAVVMPEPKTQYATALIYDAKPAQDTVEKFALTPELIKALSVFQVREHASKT